MNQPQWRLSGNYPNLQSYIPQCRSCLIPPHKRQEILGVATMSTGLQRKRAKTIDAFFAPKQPRNVVGIDPPNTRQGLEAHCAMDDAGAGSRSKDAAPYPLVQVPQPCAIAPGNSAAAKQSDHVAPAIPGAGKVSAASAINADVAQEKLADRGSPGQSPRRTGPTGLKRRHSPESGSGEGVTDAMQEEEEVEAIATTTTMDTVANEDLPSGSADRPPAGGVDGPAKAPDDDSCAQEAPALGTAEQPPPLGTGTGTGTLMAEDGLTPAQRAQMIANRNRALARRAVSESNAPGGPPLRLFSLLVESSWREVLAGELAGANMKQLEAFLQGEWAPGRKPVFPPKDCIFQTFNACPFDQVRVVILGQDPYHGPGQAMGLSFSVPRDVRQLPPSLINIYKEAATDLGWSDRPGHGDLSAWSVQGVLLLNTCLTVRQGEANSHSKRGWEQFTDAAIRVLSERRSGIVFLLWGNPAQAKASLVNTRKHHVLKAAHPSPLSASRGFFGCRHFSKTNELLEAQGLPPIQWRPV
ncbi:hypothetical protein VaNZ11_010865 [Volvox africanus]|uniref:Uracil-DNA glycosylase n=1 Tax=Volvox africanus TaxID=51714 RepID=A0ABQ5SBR5_9CHLO|nr:hypothetical protein VaNZ11_010865 [Volvox africanus]